MIYDIHESFKLERFVSISAGVLLLL